MGGGKGQKRGRTQRRDFKHSRENVWKQRVSDASAADNPSWQPFATQNPAFEEYYKVQCIVPEEEWDDFMQVLLTPLPAAIRVNPSGQFFKDILLQLENEFMEAEVANENDVRAIRPLPWYPDNLAWHLNFSRMQLRKNLTLQRLHDFLKIENETGNITRQEAVSMVPPLFLDVQPEHFVLDMCAAPGSKTFQLLEMIHQSMKHGPTPSGLIVANDADVQRCNLLIHQTKRMCSSNLIVTNHEAQHFPGSSLKKHIGSFNPECIYSHADESASNEFSKSHPLRAWLLFDRILCDVPCSGDGTLRKAPDIWRKWNSGMGNGVHRLQVQIAMRGIELLKVGGRMVYSTCSLNPVENEAVVAEILRRGEGSIDLVDVSGELPELIRRPGLKRWKVRDKGIWLSSYGEVNSNRQPVLVPSMFASCQTSHLHVPNGDAKCGYKDGLHAEDEAHFSLCADGSTIDARNGKNNHEEVSIFPLERCMRIMPHDQNTGAFFIAVLRKLAPLSAMKKTHVRQSNDISLPAVQPCENLSDEIISHASDAKCNNILGATLDQSDGASDISVECHKFNKTLQGKMQMQGKWRGVDPVVFFKDEDTLNSLREFYGIDQSFQLDGHLVARNIDLHHVKRLYYVSTSVWNILEQNSQAGHLLKIASLGLKMFERQTSTEGRPGASSCAFRISSEGLPLLLPHITKQLLMAPFADFEHLLKFKTIKFADFVDPDVGAMASNLMLGCCIVILDQYGQSDAISGTSSKIAIGAWKGRTNISVMVSEADCMQLLERLRVHLGKGDNQVEMDNADAIETVAPDICSTDETVKSGAYPAF